MAKNTAFCPACNSEFDLAATECPICMRPRSRAEIMHDILVISQAPARRRRAIKRILLLAAAAAAAGYLAWPHRAGLSALGRAAKVKAVAWLGLDRDVLGRPIAPAAGQPPVPAAPAEAAPAAVAPASTSTASASAAPAGVGVATTPVVGAAAPRPARPDYWVVEGLVYDLFSLKPVSGAQVIFTSRISGDALRARTDASGRYSLHLPRMRQLGYAVTVRHKAYQDDYLDEDEPPYQYLGLARRQEAADLLHQSAIPHVPFLPDFGQDSMQHDLVLLPR